MAIRLVNNSYLINLVGDNYEKDNMVNKVKRYRP